MMLAQLQFSYLSRWKNVIADRSGASMIRDVGLCKQGLCLKHSLSQTCKICSHDMATFAVKSVHHTQTDCGQHYEELRVSSPQSQRSIT